MARIAIKGVPISPGIAIGSLFFAPDSLISEKRSINDNEIAQEIAFLNAACEKTRNNLEITAKSISPALAEFSEILTAQVELARDSRILTNATARIRHKKICAAWALSETISELCEMFQDLADPYLSARAGDIRAIGKKILSALTGIEKRQFPLAGSILAAYELSPADILENDLHGILGLLTVEGGATSHIAILARGLQLPAVSGLAGLIENGAPNETVILDGMRGLAILDPDEADLAYYRALKTKFFSFENEARSNAETEAKTRDGLAINTFANLDRSEEVHDLVKSGAEGIGLYRTEYSYFGSKLPDESRLVKEYRRVLQGATGKRVVFRTLDIGADKLPGSLSAMKEPNPALGMRGIRLCLKHEEILRTQLKAILKACEHEIAEITVPMLTSLDELHKVRMILKEIQAELQDIPHARETRLGVMIETPAAVFISPELARECDFLSLGTNDLLHYIMAIDRNNRHVAYLHDPIHPAFLRAIKQVSDAGRKNGKEVCLCGELASDPLGLPLIIGLGITSISAIPRFIPVIKHLARKLDSRQCAKIATRALEGEDPEKTRRLLKGLLDECMVSNLLFPSFPISTRQVS